MEELNICVSSHAIKRFKQREKIKNIHKMYRRAYQAYEKGKLFEWDENGNGKYLLNCTVYVFNKNEKQLVTLLTLYKADKSDGRIKILLKPIIRARQKRFYENTA
ncbi:MAG: hypothetical protein HDP34_02590 [Clostridia bacterium]|nr:hypothetical protein [Clostridia bacterium]